MILALMLCFACSLGISARAADDNPAAGTESGALPSAEPRVITPSRPGVLTGLGELALSRAYPDETVWLSLGEEHRVLGLLLTERALPAKGALMILPEAGATAASGITGSMAQQLANKGWAVLTVGLEAPSPSLKIQLERRPEPPEASPEDDASDATPMKVDVKADDDSGQPETVYREHVQEVLQAGLAVLVSRGYEQPALLTVGRASNYIATLPSAGDSVGAIIWVAPIFYPQDKASLASDLSRSGVSDILELYDSLSAGQVSGKMRVVALRQAGLTGYERQPVALHQPPSTQDAPSLVSRIDAWLLSR